MLERIFLSLFFLSCIGTVFALDIVKNAEPRSQIVVDANNANSLLAAKDLQFYLERISGARLEIVNAASDNGLNAIYVGTGKQVESTGYALPHFTGSGYDILIEKNYAVLAGNNWNASCKYNEANAIVSGCNDNGDMHAVAAFLEKIGVRFYAPGDEGTIIPQLKNIVIETGRTTRQAAFSRREYTSKYGFDESTRLWFMHLKCGGRTPAVYGNTLENVIKDKKAQQSWLAEEEEGMPFPEACIPRYSDASFQKACVEWASNFFNANPDAMQLSLGAPEAGHCLYDWRDKNKYMTLGVSEPQSYANMLFDFYNAVATELKKTHPGKLLIWHAFNSNSMPEQLQYRSLPENVIPAADEISPALYTIPKQARRYLSYLDEMTQKMKPQSKTLQKENWRDYDSNPFFAFPEFFANALQKMRSKQRDFIDGVCADLPSNGKSITRLPLMNYMIYVNSKLMWEPDLDLEALQDEYLKQYFGPAAQEMKSFHACCEQIWSRPVAKAVAVKNGFLQQMDVATVFDILERARKTVAQDSVYCRRIDAIADEIQGLKSLFKQHEPKGQWTEASIFLADSIANGDFTKYNCKWQQLKPVNPNGGNDRTDVAFGLTENCSHLFVAAKCHSANMKGILQQNRLPDDKDILLDEHIEIFINTPNRSHYLVAVNIAGNVYDEAFDLDVIHCNKKSILWSPRTKAFIKKYDDRWEVEVAIPTEGFGYPFNCLNVPWGINVIRAGRNYSNPSALEPEGGMKEKVNPSKWRRLWKKAVDFDGLPIQPNTFILTCNNKYPEPYKVTRAKGEVDLAGEWDSPSWRDLKSAKLMPCMKKAGDRNIHYPDTQVKMQYDHEYIYVMFQVKDRYVLAIAKNDMELVCLDSCVELFIRPANVPHYYNFEMNCGGRMMLMEVENIDAGQVHKLSPDVLKRIKRFHSMPEIVNPEITEPVTWRVAYKIPLSFFVERVGIDPDLSGQVWTANFFKCADRSSHRHWMCWNPSPGFHCPEHFGKIIFE